jgi:hypothetical protein
MNSGGRDSPVLAILDLGHLENDGPVTGVDLRLREAERRRLKERRTQLEAKAVALLVAPADSAGWAQLAQHIVDLMTPSACSHWMPLSPGGGEVAQPDLSMAGGFSGLTFDESVERGACRSRRGRLSGTTRNCRCEPATSTRVLASS